MSIVVFILKVSRDHVFVRPGCWCAPPPPHDPSGWYTGWQHGAVSRVDCHFRDSRKMPRMDDRENVLLLSGSGPMSGAVLSTAPTCFHTRIESHLFRVFRRLRLHLPPCVPVSRCGRPLKSSGHHRAACPRAGLLARRGFAVEMVAAKVLVMKQVVTGHGCHSQRSTVEDSGLSQKAFLS